MRNHSNTPFGLVYCSVTIMARNKIKFVINKETNSINTSPEKTQIAPKKGAFYYILITELEYRDKYPYKSYNTYPNTYSSFEHPLQAVRL